MPDVVDNDPGVRAVRVEHAGTVRASGDRTLFARRNAPPSAALLRVGAYRRRDVDTTLSGMLGHKHTSETLDTYGHLMGNESEHARQVMQDALTKTATVDRQ